MHPKHSVPFIKNIADIAEEAHYINPDPQNYRTRRPIGKATGAIKFGVNLCKLRPNQVSSEFHAHSKEEEFFWIQSGKAILRHGQDVITYPEKTLSN
jgi:uncharacterized cupin superfamily protein